MTFLFGGNKAFGVLMAATIGVPLYACGGDTIPLLIEWLADGMSMGSTAAFMIYIAFVMVFSLATGLVVNLLI